jgi:hypothetical protein
MDLSLQVFPSQWDSDGGWNKLAREMAARWVGNACEEPGNLRHATLCHTDLDLKFFQSVKDVKITQTSDLFH